MKSTTPPASLAAAAAQHLPTVSFSSKANPPSGPLQDESAGGVESSQQGRLRADRTASNAQPSSAPSASTSSPLSSATSSQTASPSLASTSSATPSEVVPPIASTSSPSSISLHPVSEPFGLASGAPEEFVHRKVRILRPSNTACQQGFPGVWKMEFDTTTKWCRAAPHCTALHSRCCSASPALHHWLTLSPRVSLSSAARLNPLMGWTSSKDTASQLINSLQFSTKEDAVAFAKREGFDWEVLKDHEPKVVKKSYAENYKWSPRSCTPTPHTGHHRALQHAHSPAAALPSAVRCCCCCCCCSLHRKGPPKGNAKARFTPNEAIKKDTQRQLQKEQKA